MRRMGMMAMVMAAMALRAQVPLTPDDISTNLSPLFDEAVVPAQYLSALQISWVQWPVAAHYNLQSTTLFYGNRTRCYMASVSLPAGATNSVVSNLDRRLPWFVAVEDFYNVGSMVTWWGATNWTAVGVWSGEGMVVSSNLTPFLEISNGRPVIVAWGNGGQSYSMRAENTPMALRNSTNQVFQTAGTNGPWSFSEALQAQRFYNITTP